jgi:hypothetical protein
VKRGHRVFFTPTYALVQRLLAAKRDLRLEKELAVLDVFDAVILDVIVGDHHLGCMRLQNLKQPLRLRPLFEAHASWLRDRLQRLDERLAVRFDDSRLEPSAARVHDRERRACRMHIETDIPIHGVLLR